MSAKNEITGVYIVGCHSLDKLSYQSGVSDKDYANLKNIRPVEIVHDGPRTNPRGEKALSWGVPVLEDFIPKEYFVKGPKRPIADFAQCYEMALVSERFKAVVEALEPGVHQFFPVQLYWRGKKPVEGQYYWFVVCNALDSVNEEHSPMPPREVIYSPRYEKDITFFWETDDSAGRSCDPVFDKVKIGGCQIWVDKYLVSGPRAYATNLFKEACEAENITGLSLGAYGDLESFEVV